MTRPRRWPLVAGALVAAALAIIALVVRSPRRPPEPVGTSAASAPPASQEAPRATAGAGTPRPRIDEGPSPADTYVDPSTLSPDEREARRRQRLDEAARARAAWNLFPPYSRPISGNEDMILPHHVEPTVRPLAKRGPQDPSGPEPKALVRQTQDRMYLAPGDAATLGIEASVDGKPTGVRVVSSEIVTSTGTPPTPSAPLGAVPFTTQGGAAIGTLVPPADKIAGYTGSLLVRVQAEVGGETGTLVFAFVVTGAPPARFTGVVRDTLENGSVVFHLGIEVHTPGRYRIVGRIDDGHGRPLALADFNDDLDASAREVALVLFGKIARDEGAASPYSIHDVEGFRLLDGVYPDREIFPMWTGPYRSAAYPLDQLSPEPFRQDPAPARSAH